MVACLISHLEKKVRFLLVKGILVGLVIITAAVGLAGPTRLQWAGEVIADPGALQVQYTIFAGKLWRSQDLGAHWRMAGPPGIGARAVAARPGGREGAAMRYGCSCAGSQAGYGTSVVYLLQGNGLYHSYDKGISWSQMAVRGARPAEMVSLQVDPNNEGRLYAVLTRDGREVRSLDAGYTWHMTDPGDL